jgi:hypothetical protein
MAIYGTLTENSVSTSKNIDPNHLFIYDTSKDSDGGAWRLKSSHTSWYNETLNTSLRGSRKEFPVVALIAVDDHNVFIYDADDPSFPLWMTFRSSTAVDGTQTNVTKYAVVLGAASDLTSCAACNGKIYFGSSANGAFFVDLVEDSCYRLHSNGLFYGGVVVDRDGDLNFSLGTRIPLNPDYKLQGDNTGQANIVYDIAVCIPPNSPIDPNTGLTRPRVAISTSDMVTIVREDVGYEGSTLYYQSEGDGAYATNRSSPACSFDTDGNLVWISNESNDTSSNVVFYDNYLQPKVDVSQSYYRLDRNVGLVYNGTIQVSNRDGANIGNIGYWAPNNSGRVLTDVVMTRNDLYICSRNTANTAVSIIDKQSLLDKMTTMACTIGTDYHSGWRLGTDIACLASHTTSTTLTNGTTIQDLSKEDRDFTVVGNIVTSSVAPNAELRAYSGFSNSTNYIRRAHNAADNVGSNDFTIACWFKTGSSSAPQTLIAKGGSGVVELWSLGLITQNTKLALNFALEDNSGNAVDVCAENTGPLDDDEWHLAVGVAHFGEIGKVYIDGVLVHTESIQSVGAIDTSSYDMTIGTYNNGAAGGFGGHIALPRFGSGALTDRQVKKMFDDEKKLFYDGAKCFLSASNVYSLAHDEVTDSVYAGSPSYVDEINGIAVINRESGGGANALDTHDGLVVKED